MTSRALSAALFVFLWLATPSAAADLVSETQNECHAGIDSFKAKDCQAAVGQLSNCLAMPLPSQVHALILQLRGQCHAKLNQAERAVQDQKASMEIDRPRDVWPFVMLGAYYRDIKQYEQSLSALKEALKYDEDGPGTGPGMAVHYQIGQTLHQAGRYADAIEAYTRGIAIQPDYGYALYHRALSYEALGNKAQARKDLLQALELAPDEGYEEEINAKLAEYKLAIKQDAH